MVTAVLHAAMVVLTLSCQQEQLWFLDQFQPGSDFYNVPFVFRLKGKEVPAIPRHHLMDGIAKKRRRRKPPPAPPLAAAA